MAIAYDAYAFRPNAFAATIVPYLDGLETDLSRYALCSDAIKLFDEEEHVKVLLDYYGGWDRQSIAEQVKEGNSPENIAFWLLFFLYREFSLYDPGLTWQWKDNYLPRMSYIAKFLNWNDNDRELLDSGAKFESFVKKWLLKEGQSMEDIPQYWKHFHPFSTASYLGWLDSPDIDRLLQKLIEAEDAISTLQTEDFENPLRIQKIYISAKEMLWSAKSKEMCLCLIHSG